MNGQQNNCYTGGFHRARIPSAVLHAPWLFPFDLATGILHRYLCQTLPPGSANGPLRRGNFRIDRGRLAGTLTAGGCTRARNAEWIEDVNHRNSDANEPFRQLYGYGISAKRYALSSRQGKEIKVEKASGHSLGYLFSPKERKKEEEAEETPQWVMAKTPHVTVALRRSVAIVHACALVVARTSTDPRGEAFLRGKGHGGKTDFGNDLLR